MGMVRWTVRVLAVKSGVTTSTLYSVHYTLFASFRRVIRWLLFPATWTCVTFLITTWVHCASVRSWVCFSMWKHSWSSNCTPLSSDFIIFLEWFDEQRRGKRCVPSFSFKFIYSASCFYNSIGEHWYGTVYLWSCTVPLSDSLHLYFVLCNNCLRVVVFCLFCVLRQVVKSICQSIITFIHRVCTAIHKKV